MELCHQASQNAVGYSFTASNVSYSVSLTTMATLLSPLMVPLALTLTLSQRRAFPAGEV